MNEQNKERKKKMVEIQALQQENVLDLQRVARQSFYETFAEVNTQEDMDAYLESNLSLAQLTQEYNHPHSLFFMAKVDGKCVGYIKLNLASAQHEFQEDNALEIERVYVLREYHSCKVGQALLDHALEIATQKNVDYVWLGVWENNFKAISFYTKNGFVAFDKHEFILGKDIQTDILMKRNFI